MDEKIGVLLVNLGTPDAPDPKSVKRYLLEFLTDPRVIDNPWLTRQALVRGIIIPKRYKESSASYQEIWTASGSPLMLHSKSVTEKLQIRLGGTFHVELAMRYQNPSISSALQKLEKMDLSKLVVLPLFPQYASATVGSVHQRVMECLKNWETIPDLTFISQYFDHPSVIDAYVETLKEFSFEQYEHLLISFHGLPERQLRKADCHSHCLQTPDCCHVLSQKNRSCYAAQCHAMARLIAERTGLSTEKYTVTFQSRLGKDPWVKPYTADTVIEMARKGVKKLLVMCPAFTADCLETIHEIGIELKRDFIEAGGEELDLVPSLNDRDIWVAALESIIKPR